MSDAFWAVRAAESMATRQKETEAYLRQEWPGESTAWFLRLGGSDRARADRPRGAALRRVLGIFRGPGPRSDRPSRG